MSRKLMDSDEFTAQEDKDIWRMAMEIETSVTDEPGERAHSAGQIIATMFGMKYGVRKSVYFRFRFQLLPNIWSTNLLNLGEKMEISTKYGLQVEEEANGFTNYKPDIKVPPTNNAPSSPNDLLKEIVVKTEAVSPLPEEKIFLQLQLPKTTDLAILETGEDFQDNRENLKRKRFSDNEQTAQWTFLFENYEKYDLVTLWNEFKKTLGSTKPAKTFAARCTDFMLPHLHLAECDVKTKLGIYKKFEVPVEKGYLEELEKHATLQIDPTRSVILDYTLKTPENDQSIRRSAKKRTPKSLEDLLAPPELKRTREDLEAPELDPKDQIVQFPLQKLIESVSGVVKEAVKQSNDQLGKELTSVIGRSTMTLMDKVEGSEKKVEAKVEEIGERILGGSDAVTVKKFQPAVETTNLQQYLTNLKAFTASLNLPEALSIQNRIDEAIRKQKNQTDQALPVKSILAMLDVGLQMIGH